MIDEFQDETQKVRMLAKIHEGLPKYFTRQMRNNVFGKGNKFDIFWNELDMYFNEETPAVDDRRHNTTMHMPLAISIRDLRDIILAKLHIKNGEPLPAEIYIPSCEWIRLQFWPTNSTTTKAIQYTGSIVQFKFHVPSEEAFFSHLRVMSATLFRYLREFLIQYRQWACFISADDKHKVPIGESVPVSTGVRNR
ncbi:hypothetical protein RhiirA4_427493 [Rhizophagus irregularis]|uniref:Uncharacterized protein n=1 Tax=Rhizophagus irregularis TaxID=588596 RepID=A0A2I1H959_9GLOM|nr:hypothetical protein RhiirA4_427493 [Rhizophagus irregularis]